jgi:hypothetical protein
MTVELFYEPSPSEADLLALNGVLSPGVRPLSRRRLTPSNASRFWNLAADAGADGIARAVLGGCFHEMAANAQHCVRPWTIYLLLLRTAQGMQVPFVLHTLTPAGVPMQAPRAAVGQVHATSCVLQLLPPPAGGARGLVTQYRITATPAIVSPGSELSAASAVTLVRVVTVSEQLAAAARNQSVYAVVESLRAYTLYNVSVEAVTAAGSSPVTVLAGLRTAVDRPPKMAAPTFTLTPDGQLVVSWEAGDDNGPVLEYVVVVDYDGSSGNETVVYRGAARNVTLAGNAGLVARGLRVRAVSSAGPGLVSEAAAFADSSNNGAGQSLGGSMTVGLAAGAALCALAIAFALAAFLRRTDSAECIAPDDWELPRDNITLLEEVGRGAFGTVFKGTAAGLTQLGTMLVAVKRCSRRTVAETDPIRDELRVLKRLSSPWHNNVSEMS